jgi:probable addiction module antidote protein
MRKYRTFDEMKEEYFHEHPEELEDFMTIIFEEYANDGDMGALLASLRTVSRVKGITVIAEKTGISRNGIQKALSKDGNPGFESINSIMHAMGYNLMPQKTSGMPLE